MRFLKRFPLIGVDVKKYTIAVIFILDNNDFITNYEIEIQVLSSPVS